MVFTHELPEKNQKSNTKLKMNLSKDFHRFFSQDRSSPKEMTELRLGFSMTIVRHRNLTVFHFAFPNCCTVNMIIDIGKKLNTKRSTIIKHDFASFIPFRFFFFFVVGSSPAIALGGICKECDFLATRKILI